MCRHGRKALGGLAIRLVPAMTNSADALEACRAIAEIYQQEVGGADSSGESVVTPIAEPDEKKRVFRTPDSLIPSE